MDIAAILSVADDSRLRAAGVRRQNDDQTGLYSASCATRVGRQAGTALLQVNPKENAMIGDGCNRSKDSGTYLCFLGSNPTVFLVCLTVLQNCP